MINNDAIITAVSCAVITVAMFIVSLLFRIL